MTIPQHIPVTHDDMYRVGVLRVGAGMLNKLIGIPSLQVTLYVPDSSSYSGDFLFVLAGQMTI